MLNKALKTNIALAIGIAACFISGCTTFNQSTYDDSFKTVLNSAQTQFQNKNYPRAIILSRAILDAEQDNQEAKTIADKSLEAQPDLSSLMYKDVLGCNMSDRIPNDIGWPGKIALYLPNRLLDVIDLITLEVGVCLGAGVSFFATHDGALGLQASAGEAMIGLNNRNLSARGTLENFTDFFPVEARSFMEARAYTAGVYSCTYHNSGIKSPDQYIYQRARDFWALGAQAQVIAYALRFEFHPVEIFDLFAGFAFFDPLHDDIGVTKGIDLSSSEREAMAQLAKQSKARSSKK